VPRKKSHRKGLKVNLNSIPAFGLLYKNAHHKQEISQVFFTKGKNREKRDFFPKQSPLLLEGTKYRSSTYTLLWGRSILFPSIGEPMLYISTTKKSPPPQ
jgi:hypothetical protein